MAGVLYPRRSVHRFVCIHGHFYQPPRENAWLERIERQESARPFHDWNARIEAECYGPNARARILDGEDHVVALDNNFEKISFNIGPTLLSWLEVYAPNTYARLLDADAVSAKAMGKGSAMAQAHGHIILPLANERDKRTQVRWGVADFKRRFGRAPDGMWLAETAACTASLRAMADEGIRFTVLAPRQAKAIKKKAATAFTPVSEVGLDTRRPYEVDVGGGKSIAVFFYDGPTSQAVAFERLLSNGDTFAGRLMGCFSPSSTEAELVHIATDGETYGHHHRFGEMALAYALRRFEREPNVTLTNYASFLERFPPKYDAQIVESSSWSCAHGVERWRADCGCKMSGEKNQAWRGPLRDTLDWLRDAVDVVFEREAAKFLRDPWDARDGYIDVILDRSPENVSAFFSKYAIRELNLEHKRVCLSLLEMQRHRMLMYTSCGWFFDDISGIETVQILQYAARVVELARAFGEDLEPELLRRLEPARATSPNTPTGREVYERWVTPSKVDASRFAATFAVTSLFGIGLEDAPAFEIEDRVVRSAKHGDDRLGVGRLTVRSTITGEASHYAFAVSHEGGPSVVGGLRSLAEDAPDAEEEIERWMVTYEEEPFEAVQSRIQGELPQPIDSLRVLPVDERVMVVERILAQAVRAAESAYRQVFTENAALLTELATIGVQPPRALSAATRVVLESDLLRAVRREPPDTRALRNLLVEARAENVPFDEPTLSFELGLAIGRTCAALEKDPALDSSIGRLLDLVEIARRMRGTFDLSRPQDLAWTVVNEHASKLAKLAVDGGRMGAWRELAAALRIRVTTSR